jgi:hypothetical protein
MGINETLDDLFFYCPRYTYARDTCLKKTKIISENFSKNLNKILGTAVMRSI